MARPETERESKGDVDCSPGIPSSRARYVDYTSLRCRFKSERNIIFC